MSRLTDLIAQTKAKDPELAIELEREFKVLSSRRSFGLNFERHRPESVELPGRPVRKGDKVRILPPRGTTTKGDQRLWRVRSFEGKATKRSAQLELLDSVEPEIQLVAVEDLVVVAEFRDYIYPGLVSTGKVEHGGDKPFHTVINGENFHALEALTFTHRGKIDVIYIDPPYNTGAKDWKYNNDYVESEDLYRHSKWLAMMERRLKLAGELLNKDNSVLIVTIDEKEYLRLGLLLEQIFPDTRIQMISSVISPTGSGRTNAFRRNDEYIFFVMFGTASPVPMYLPEHWKDERRGTSTKKIRWSGLMRSGTEASRSDRPGMFFPIILSANDYSFIRAGESLDQNNSRETVIAQAGTILVWPIRSDDSEGRWQVGPKAVNMLWEKGFLKIGKMRKGVIAISYLKAGEQKKVKDGAFGDVTFSPQGNIEVSQDSTELEQIPPTQWSTISHSASEYGSTLLRKFLPGRKFPFPKSLYAVEDSLRFFVKEKPEAVILDFFAGSGTTAHAVMRLNRQDGCRRQCISITNNEVAAEEQKALREQGLRPGDTEWEQWGICDYITKPRIEAAITGKTLEGKSIIGEYKFTDEFSMTEGFIENAEFFTLTYETPIAVSHNKAFARVAPLLWMRAGSEGRRIDTIPADGWELADTYGLLTDLDKAGAFCKSVIAKSTVRIVYIVTDDDRRFQAVARHLPDKVEPVRLYESYLNNFRFSFGR